MKNNTDILDKLVENERKQKMVTTITAVLISIFVIIIFILVINLKKSKETIEVSSKKIESQSADLKKKYAELDVVKKELDMANLRLQQDTTTLRRTNGDYLKVQENVQEAINKIENAPANPPNPPAHQNNNGYENGPGATPAAKNPMIKTKNEIKILSKIIENGTTKKPKIYIQYKEGFSELSSKLKTGFLSENYIVPKEQFMGKLNFSSSVRYFNTDDKVLAEKVAQQAQEITGTKFKVQFIQHLKSPLNQIEVWVGR